MSNSHKSKQKGLVPAYGPRFAQVSLTPVPLRGHAATGHPWPDRSSPGIHAGRPTPQNLHSASRKGRQIKIKIQITSRSKADQMLAYALVAADEERSLRSSA
ncbi:hypothetical protein FJD37_05700 [Pseudomonas saxonica]|uniref:Uncharacterized protein n=1 Tax=Pseudomonas saxonica TaxID=2600598 RepID=A0A5C5Q1J8_9PSED|nr:hypothetical protein FJD37_05700 [Pseudomonas saxonica]